MSSDAHVVQIRELTKKYGEFTALDRLSLDLDPGQILGFIGPNGAGKTTMIKILVGLAKPTSGTAHIAGIDCVRDPMKIKRTVGYMPDTFGGYDQMRVREYLDFFGAAFKIPRKKRQERIAQVMELTNSDYMKDLYVGALSHGMRQRVAIGRTLLHDPRVLIMDEPANGLDPNARIEMRQILLRLSEMGKTLIVTSHILPELSHICDHVAIITQGKLRAFGTLQEIMRRVSTQRVIDVQLVSAQNMDKIVELLRQHLEDGAEVMPSPGESALRFKTASDDMGLAKVLNALAKAGAPIVQYREVPLDLEDAFLTVTGKQTKAEQRLGESAGQPLGSAGG